MTTLKALCDQHGITIASRYVGRPTDPEWTDPGATEWRCTIRRGAHTITVPFCMGSAHTSPPAAACVLGCLLFDASAADGARDFADFAESLGYDPDSRRAERIYRACQRTSARLRRFLGDDFDAFMQAER